MTENKISTQSVEILQKPESKSSIKKEFYVKIIIEVLSVVFAVLLALGVDEWRDNKEK